MPYYHNQKCTHLLAAIIRSKCDSIKRSHKYIGTGTVKQSKFKWQSFKKNHTTSFKYTNIKMFEQMHKVQKPLPVPRSPIMA